MYTSDMGHTAYLISRIKANIILLYWMQSIGLEWECWLCWDTNNDEPNKKKEKTEKKALRILYSFFFFYSSFYLLELALFSRHFKNVGVLSRFTGATIYCNFFLLIPFQCYVWIIMLLISAIDQKRNKKHKIPDFSLETFCWYEIGANSIALHGMLNVVCDDEPFWKILKTAYSFEFGPVKNECRPISLRGLRFRICFRSRKC